MGDVLHALPAIAALRARHPEWFLGWVIDPRWLPLLESADAEVASGVCSARPIVDRVHRVPTQAWKHEPMTAKTARGVLALRRELRAEPYDVCVDMQGLIRSALVGRMSGAGEFVGRAKPREAIARHLYDRTVATPAAHVIEQGGELVSGAVGETLRPAPVALPHDAAAERWVDEMLERTLPRELWDRFAFFAPTAGWGAKQWPKDRYGAVAVALAEAGWATLVNASSADDISSGAVVESSLGCAVAVPSTMPQMMALIRRAALVIAGDTGPLHLAAAMERPLVGLYGPTSPERTGPYAGTYAASGYSAKIRVLRHATSMVNRGRAEETEIGLSRIPVAEVVEAALSLLRA